LSLTGSLDVGDRSFDETIEKLDVLLQNKLLQISELSECFQSSDGKSPATSSIKDPHGLLEDGNSRVDGQGDGNVSDDSFEDLRT
jgi:hypothetical protein